MYLKVPILALSCNIGKKQQWYQDEAAIGMETVKPKLLAKMFPPIYQAKLVCISV